MSILSNFLILFISFILAMFIYGSIIFPIFYMLPKSIYLIIKHKIKPTAIFKSMITIIIWALLSFVVFNYFPILIKNKYVLNNYSKYGQIIAIITLLYNGLMTKRGREDLTTDYWKAMKKYTL